MKNHLKLNLLYLLIFIITLYGCGTDTTISSQSSDKNNEYGNATFGLKWENPQNSHDMSLRAKGEAISELSYAPIDCTAIGVLTVTANVYDSNQAYLVNGGPWDCTSHSGTITNVPSGDSRKITVYGKDASDRIIYRGETTGVTITANQTTNAGSVTMSSVTSDTTAPTDGTLSGTAGNSQVSLSWSNFSDSGGIDYYKLVYSTSSTPSSCSGGTQIYLGSGTSYTHTGLTNSTTYYYRVCAIDNAGNTSSGATASGIPTSSGGTTTTGSAPSAPTGVSASAGNGQATISWSSVSGATSYNIYWSTSSGVTKTTGTKVTGATSPYTHTGRTNGTTYYYVVTGVGTYGEGSESSQASGTPAGSFTRTISGKIFYNTGTFPDGFELFNDYSRPLTQSDTVGNPASSIAYSSLNGSNGYKMGGVVSDLVFQADVMVSNASAAEGIYLGFRNDLSGNYYYLKYGPYYGGLLLLGKDLVGGGGTVLQLLYGLPSSSNTWYKLEFRASGSSLKVYFNNTLQINKTDTSLTSGYTTLTFGVYNGSNTWYIDNIKIFESYQITVNNLQVSQKIEFYDSSNNLKASATVATGQTSVIMDVSSLSFPFTGYFKVYNSSGTLIYTSQTYTDIWGGDKFTY